MKEQSKRDLIYTDERLKAIAGELADLTSYRKERATQTPTDEGEKRYWVYSSERINRLKDERELLVEKRRDLTSGG